MLKRRFPGEEGGEAGGKGEGEKVLFLRKEPPSSRLVGLHTKGLWNCSELPQ